MTPEHAATRLIIDGYVKVESVFSPAEVTAFTEAFERRASELEKRWMDWDALAAEPDFLNWIAHPNLMSVIDAFGRHFEQTMMFANCSGARDIGPAPGAEVSAETPTLRQLGWHDDVSGVTNPRDSVMQLSVTCLLYLDETFADSGAYYAAAGSHHLARADADDRPLMAAAEQVLSYCDLVPVPVQPGDAILHRAHHWHGVMRARQRRRVALQSYVPDSCYDLQVGHTQVGDASRALLPPERHRYLRRYRDRG